MTGADALSMLRVALAILITGAATTFFTPAAPTVMLFAFVIGVAFDILGSVLARRHETPNGRVLHSLADKALVYSVLVPIALRGFPPLELLLPLVVRDAVTVALQVLTAWRGKVLRTERVGRLKTAILYLGCGALLALASLQSGAGLVTIDAGDLGTIITFLFLSQLAIAVGTLLSFVTLGRYILTLRSTGA